MHSPLCSYKCRGSPSLTIMPVICWYLHTRHHEQGEVPSAPVQPPRHGWPALYSCRSLNSSWVHLRQPGTDGCWDQNNPQPILSLTSPWKLEQGNDPQNVEFSDSLNAHIDILCLDASFYTCIHICILAMSTTTRNLFETSIWLIPVCRTIILQPRLCPYQKPYPSHSFTDGLQAFWFSQAFPQSQPEISLARCSCGESFEQTPQHQRLRSLQTSLSSISSCLLERYISR